MKEYFLSLKDKYHISDGLMEQIRIAYDAVQPYWQPVSNNTATAQIRILNAFQKHQASDFHLNGSTGYGYGDTGRDILELIWADIFKAEKALVRSNIASGTHALALGLFGNLLPGDTFVSISGMPYDTLQTIIGHHGEPGTLSELGIQHKVVELVDDAFDFDGIARTVTPDTKMVCIQRSRGYSWRKSLSIAKIAEAIAFVKKINPQICVVIYTLDFQVAAGAKKTLENLGITDVETIQVAVSRLESNNSFKQQPAPWIITGKAGE